MPDIDLKIDPVTEQYQGNPICDMSDAELKTAIHRIVDNYHAIRETIVPKSDDFIPFMWITQIGTLVIEPMFPLLLREWIRRQLIS